MDKIVECRMNRSLLIHGLENLVFEKRQRKSVQPISHTFPSNPHEKKVEKKNSIAIFQKKNSQKNKIQKKKNKLAEDSSKKPQSKQKNKNRHKKKADEAESEQQISQLQQSSQIINIQQIKHLQTRSIEKKISIQVKQQKEVKYNQGKKQEAQELSKQNQITSGRLQNAKRGRGRPKKDHSEIHKMEEQIVKSQQRPKVQQVIILKPTQQHINKLPCKVQDNNMVQRISQHDKDASSSKEKVKTRERRVKTHLYKSYNENQIAKESQQSFQDQPFNKKKKKISKSYRSKTNKPYSLNRIFRKEAKRHFSTFTLDLDLNKVSFSRLIKEFGMFDLIHFSLPISYLYMFNQVISLIQKGFIFVWAEKGETQIGYHLLNRWGFDVIDQIIWVKANEDQNKIQADNVDICNSIIDSRQEKTKSSKQLFINSKSTCLVGYKCPLGNKAEYRTKVSNNIIFAKSLQGMKKPAEIYEIADLMMPGAKKLEFGNDAQKGWLNIKHHQKTNYRCNICLRAQNLYFLINNVDKPVQCKRCIVNNIKSQLQTDSVEEITKQYQSLQKIFISNVIYESNSSRNCCESCKKTIQLLQFEGLFIIESYITVCIDCFRQYTKDRALQSTSIVVEKKQIYLQSSLACSDCGVLVICDMYFQCNKCKNHTICKNCFWKTKLQITETNNQIEEDSKKITKKEITHEWRLKFVKNSPMMRFSCFGCKKDLSIPFWCCQTCQNWFWCGQCNKGNSDTHPHCQTSQHVEYIMI